MARQRSNKRPRVFRGPASHYAGADTEIMEVSFSALSTDQDPAKLGRAHEYAGCLMRFQRSHDGTALISIYAADDAIRVDAPPQCTPLIESIAVVLESRLLSDSAKIDVIAITLRNAGRDVTPAPGPGDANDDEHVQMAARYSRRDLINCADPVRDKDELKAARAAGRFVKRGIR